MSCGMFSVSSKHSLGCLKAILHIAWSITQFIWCWQSCIKKMALLLWQKLLNFFIFNSISKGLIILKKRIHIFFKSHCCRCSNKQILYPNRKKCMLKKSSENTYCFILSTSCYPCLYNLSTTFRKICHHNLAKSLTCIMFMLAFEVR